jgi:hypothetical protein
MAEPQPTKHVLSKSTFVRGCQCPKSLYLYKHFYKTRDPISPAQRAIFARGTNVGLLAHELFPGGIDASPPTPFQYLQSVRKTRQLIEAGTEVIYEAAFTTEGVMAAMDILVKEPDRGPGGTPAYRAYEVKSSTAISDTYLLDAALQYWVITGAGIDLRDISIVHIDNTYVRRGEIEVGELFRSESVLEEARKRQGLITVKVDELKAVIAAPEVPEVEIGPHCNNPYPCDFIGTCWKGVPAYSVFDIARLSEEKKFQLFRGGTLEVASVPQDFPLSDKQRTQVDAERDGRERIDRAAIAEFLGTLEFPLYFVDFESFQPAVPLYDNSRPYQQLPFQFSLHVLETQGAELRHEEFLAEAGPDPRRKFLETLLSVLGDSGSVLVYNRTFESTRLSDLATDIPELASAVEAVQSRIVDLMEPFQSQSYYTPAMRGSYSIKRVLPALVPELSYASLGIQDGTAASIAFERLIRESSPRKRSWVRKQLLDYCRMDTMAMVRIFERLAAEASG